MRRNGVGPGSMGHESQVHVQESKFSIHGQANFLTCTTILIPFD